MPNIYTDANRAANLRTTTDTAYDRAIAYARELGAEHGKAAASWVFDGNTPRETYARILRGLEEGDPEILDTLPAPDLSGEWADSLTGPQLVEDAIDAGRPAPGVSHIGHTAGDAACEYQDWFSDICDAYEMAFSDAVSDELTRAARYQLEG